MFAFVCLLSTRAYLSAPYLSRFAQCCLARGEGEVQGWCTNVSSSRRSTSTNTSSSFDSSTSVTSSTSSTSSTISTTSNCSTAPYINSDPTDPTVWDLSCLKVRNQGTTRFPANFQHDVVACAGPRIWGIPKLLLESRLVKFWWLWVRGCCLWSGSRLAGTETERVLPTRSSAFTNTVMNTQ